MRLRIFVYLMLASSFTLQAQTTKEEVESNILQTGGNYFSYPGPKGKLTPAPAGYHPFYISHYGRHGSRYMTSYQPYEYLLKKMNAADKANALTPLGKTTLGKLKIAGADAYLRTGDLSKLGAKQHREIAQRMFQNYPEVLSKPLHIDAKSSVVMRCAISMSNFCQQLRAMNPKLQFNMEASERNMWIVANRDDSIPKLPGDKVLEKKFKDFKTKMYKPARLVSTLFTDTAFVHKEIDPARLMDNFYHVAEDMQCLPELKLSFLDLFTKDELFDMWQCKSIEWGIWEGLIPSSTPRYKAHCNLLRNIINTADGYIARGETGATLRFGHDSVVVPLAYLLHLNGCDNMPDDFDNAYKYWSDFKITPMGCNIQIIFFRKAGSKDVLVKFLLNENEKTIPVKTDCAPYYHWKDVKAFYEAKLKN
jgi:hypothetical protein